MNHRRRVPELAGVWEPALQTLAELVDARHAHLLEDLHPHGLDGQIVVIATPNPYAVSRALGSLPARVLHQPFRLVRCDQHLTVRASITTEEVTAP
ncbi:MAG TPA: hypothetical protein VFZ00_01530 [Solirubrobacter sp.]|nr:hypothetical protein [Solirubrobacter sp.]